MLKLYILYSTLSFFKNRKDEKLPQLCCWFVLQCWGLDLAMLSKCYTEPHPQLLPSLLIPKPDKDNITKPGMLVIPVIPALVKLRKTDCEFKASLGS
jgi:hypothetical protein